MTWRTRNSGKKIRQYRERDKRRKGREEGEKI